MFDIYLEANGYQKSLLSFLPLLNEERLSAEEHKNLLNYVLSLYQKKIGTQCCCDCWDNCEVIKALSSFIKIPLIGCASHRFALAVNEFIVDYEPVLGNINSLMHKLRTKLLSVKLRKFSNLLPVIRNVTRWSSTFQMIVRYEELRPPLLIFAICFANETSLIDYFLSPPENNEIDALMLGLC